jgi:SET domain-containing protein
MLVVRTQLKPSAIEGLGLFALEPIPAGAPVWVETEASVRSYTEAEVAGAPPGFVAFLRRYTYEDVRDGRLVLCLDDARFMNHSDDPNTRNSEDLTATVAARDIAAGEELTCDYREFDRGVTVRLG